MEDKESFLNLINELYTENREISFNKLIDLFKTKTELINLLADECKLNDDLNNTVNLEFINQLINLPQITSNIFQLLNNQLFRPDKYYDNLCIIIYEVLKVVHSNLKDGHNQNLLFITNLIGQICFNKYENCYWSRVGCYILNNSRNDLIWRKIGRRLINQQNQLYLENLVKILLFNALNYEEIEWFLGSEIQLNEDDNSKALKHLLTNKFILVNYFPLEKELFINNLIGYLINFNLELFNQMFYNLLSVWSNSTFVRHQIKDQHFYLCRIIICSLKFMIKLEYQLDQKQYLSLILHGAETHLKMVELNKRNAGLFVTEQLMNYLNKNLKLEDKLNFEIDLNDKNIQVLIKLLEDKQLNNNLKDNKSNKSKDNSFENKLENDLNKIDNHKLDFDYISNEEQDDDLIPYEIKDDQPIIKTKKPIYLKDCLEGLMNNEDIEWNQTCLECLPDLINKNRSQAKELTIDFLRTLLFLDNEEDKELNSIRYQSMIEFCSLNPLNAANYLTGQVYEQNLTIIRKLEILDVIVDTAKKLTNLENRKSIEDNQIKSIQNIVREPRKKEWEKIIEERIKSKTRILTSNSLIKSKFEYKNEFINYVNHFFYPLINNYDKKDITLKFNDDDYFVLGRIIITLAELLKSVSQTHVTRNMAKSLIDFLNVFKNHSESYVRKSITLCIHSILTNVPNYFLFNDLQIELFNLRDYLINLKKLDPETFHSHGTLVLYTLQDQLNEYQNSIKMNDKIQKIKLLN